MAHALDRIGELLDFWFADAPRLDGELASRFGDDLARAARGELDHWLDSADGALALVILLDQMPRRVFAGKAQAFSFDSHAMAVAEAAVLRGHDRALPPDRRRVLYMPFLHSESLPDQRYGVSLFEQAGDDTEGLELARASCAVVGRFDRFPQRNDILDRETSPEEEAFLNSQAALIEM